MQACLKKSRCQSCLHCSRGFVLYGHFVLHYPSPSTFPPLHFLKISQQPTLTLLYNDTIRDVIAMPYKEKQDNGIFNEQSIIKNEILRE